jgi:hypothetical protein
MGPAKPSDDQNVERRQSEESAPEPVEAEGGTS